MIAYRHSTANITINKITGMDEKMDVKNWEQLLQIAIMIASSLIIMVFCQHAGHQLIYRKLGIKGIRLFIMPFVVMHELSHALIAAICGFKHIDLKIESGWDKELGSVTYRYPITYLGVMGVTLTSFAPLMLAIFLIYLLCLYSDINIFNIPIQKEVISVILVHLYTTLNWYEMIIGVILLCGISLGLTPSTQDLRIAVRGIFLMILFSTIIIVGVTFLNVSLIEKALYGLGVLAKLFAIGASASVFAFVVLMIGYHAPRVLSKAAP